MAHFKFNGVGIKGISVTVPKNVLKTSELTEHFSKSHLSSFIESTGIEEKRIVSEEVCASDLCFNAAINLINTLSIPLDHIDVLIFVSQTPDYRAPSTSVLLQHKLKLSKSTLAFDVNMACTGYLNGLFIAYSIIIGSGANNVLLLVGDTLSKVSSPKDKATALLLGDAGSATLISKGNEYQDSYFSFNTDGSNFKAINIPMGGFKNMSSVESLKDMEYDDGSVRNGEQLFMDGMEVFGFAISELPKDMKSLLEYAEINLSDINKFVLHQANRFMIDTIAKKVKMDKSKILYSIDKFGNTSATSIPLTMVHKKEQLNNGELLLMNAIGSGFAWGTMLMYFNNCILLELNEI